MEEGWNWLRIMGTGWYGVNNAGPSGSATTVNKHNRYWGKTM
jgi:hypothetical protein